MVSQKSTPLLQRWVVQNIFHAVSLTSHTTSRDFLLFFKHTECLQVMAFGCCYGDKRRKGVVQDRKGGGVGTTCKKTVHRSRCEVTSSVFRMKEKSQFNEKTVPSLSEWHHLVVSKCVTCSGEGVK